MGALADRRVVVAELRRKLGPAPVERPEPSAATGIEPLDRLLAGGIARGRMTEIVGRRSAGRTSIVLAALGAATRRGETVALVDVDGAIDVGGALAAGIDLSRLLWAHAGSGERGLRAAELVLAAGGFGVVALDLGERRARVPDAAWLRLERAAEKSGSALLIAAPGRAAGAFAAFTVEASRPRPALVGRGLEPRVLVAVSRLVALVRSRRSAPSEPAEIRFRYR